MFRDDLIWSQKHTHKKLFHPKDTQGNFLNWHDWLNSLLASAFSSMSTLFVTANACVLNLLSKTPCLFDKLHCKGLSG